VDDQSPGREVLVVPIQQPDPRTPVQALPSVAMPAENPLGGRLRRDQAAPGPDPGRDRTKIAELLADERCSQALPFFLATTDVGKTSGSPVAEEGDGAASEASEWENEEQFALLREGEERGWGRRTWRITGAFFVTLYFSLVFCLPFVIQLLAVSERELRLGVSGVTHRRSS